MAPSTDTSATVVSKTTTQKPKATQSITTTTHPGVECTGVATWSSTTAYDQGANVVYGVHLWIAKWRTQADVPGGAGEFIKGWLSDDYLTLCAHPISGSLDR